MNLKKWITSILVLLLAVTPDNTGQLLPEVSVNRVTECEGTVLRGSCPANHVNAVKDIQYGTTNCAISANDPECCDYEPTDCLTNYTGTAQQAACSGRELCNEVTIGEVDTSSCGPPYPDLNHYLTMEYYCIPESRIAKMCDSVSLTETGSPLYTWNTDYPTGLIRAASTSCSCSVEASSCNSHVKVYFVHFELGDGGGSCSDNQNIKIDDKGSIQTYTCSHNNNYKIITKITSSSNYITVTLDTAMPISDGKFWIGFEATEGSAELSLDCPAKEQVLCKDCERPSKVGYVFEKTSDLAVGTTVGVQSCATGYEGPPSVNEITCMDNGNWSDVTGCSLVDCTNPTKVGYNLGIPTATTYQGTVSVISCDTGYTGSPSETELTCQDTGSWSDVTGCAIVNCSTPIKVGYKLGTVTATTYRDTVNVVSCDTGYTGNPSVAELTCQDTGNWSDVTGCTIVNCTDPIKVGYRLGTPSAITYLGTVSVDSCDTGYTGNPSETELTCQDTGSWSDVTGCTIVNCTDPIKVGYRLGTPSAITYLGTVSVDSCDTGYTGNPSETELTCQDTGSWSDVTGCSIVNCTDPIKVGYRLGTPSAITYLGTVSVDSCDTGYTGNPSETELTCRDTGNWSDVNGCTIVNCTDPIKVGYRLGTPSAITYLGTVSVDSCDTGYTGNPSETELTCQDTGSWSDVTGCTIVNCTDPIKVGYRLGTPSAITYLGTVSVDSCDTGYTGNPSETQLTCQDTGSWSDVTGCTIVNCTDPIKVGYRLGTPSAITYLGTVSVDSCDTGYTGNPSETQLTCQDTGSWSDVTGCTIVNCTDPIKVGYRLGTPSAITYLGTVSVDSCDTGYTGNPSETELTCQDTGSWSDVTGCTIVNCTDPIKVGYRLGTPSAITYLGTVSVDSCDTGYTGNPSETELTCQDTGNWSDVSGCIIVDCDAPTKVGYILGNPAITTYNSTVSVDLCEIGYAGTPSQSQLTCQANGNWSDATGCFIVDCNDPNKVGYILGNVAATTFGSSVGVSDCDTGYTGTPDVNNIECLASGHWSAVSGCMVGNCNSPTKTGYILEPPSNTTYGVTVGVTSCSTGYNGSPSVAEITCLASGNWSEVSGCIIVDCGSPASPGYDLGTPTETTYQGRVSVDSCATGYNGARSVDHLTCNADGNWSEVTGCQLVDCNIPTKTGYQLGNPSATTYGGNASIVSCDTGYTGNPSVIQITCEAHGNWTEVSGCSIVSCNSPVKTGYSLGAVSATTYGANVSVDSCYTGYTGNPSVSQITCEADGSWSDVSGCNIVNCGSPTQTGYQLGNNPSDTTYGASVRVDSCGIGYIGNLSVNTITCQADGSWSEVTGCIIVNCNSPAKTGYQIGRVSATTYGATVSVDSCDTGYTGNPSVNRIACEAGGSWSDVLGCSIVNCNDPSKTGYQLGDPSATTYGGIVSVISCETGYTGTPAYNQIACGADGSWSEVTGCNIVNCSSPIQLGYRFGTPTAMTYGGTVSVEDCDTGYTGNPSVGQIACQASGSWSSVSGCNIVDCGELSPPTHGTIQYNDETVYQSVASYSCDTGYSVEGQSTRICQADASWSTTEPTCVIKDCRTFNEPENGNATYLNGTTYQSVAILSCNTGHTLFGPSSSECQADGSWTTRDMACYQDCETLSAPENGIININETIYDSRAIFSCHTDHKLNGQSVLRCESDGTWSSQSPTCEVIIIADATSKTMMIVLAVLAAVFIVGGAAAFGLWWKNVKMKSASKSNSRNGLRRSAERESIEYIRLPSNFVYSPVLLESDGFRPNIKGLHPELRPEHRRFYLKHEKENVENSTMYSGDTVSGVTVDSSNIKTGNFKSLPEYEVRKFNNIKEKSVEHTRSVVSSV